MRGLPRVLLVAGLLSLPATLASQAAGGITLTLSHATLSDALTRLRNEFRAPLAWSGDILPTQLRLNFTFRNAPLRVVLDSLLQGANLTTATTTLGTIVIVPRAGERPAAQLQEQEIQRGISGTGVQQLDEIVTIGNPVMATPGREQPTAIATVPESRIDELSESRMSDLLRRSLPGLMLWDRGPIGPPAEIASVRGVSSFTTRGLKTYVDGVELASPELFTLLDGRGIERLEMIRGPQGAALYGPDAMNGVLQIETRRGHLGTQGIHLSGDFEGGAYQRQDLSGAIMTEAAAFDLHGGGQQIAFDAGAAVQLVDPGAAIPLEKIRTARIGSRALIGSFLLNASARIGQQEYADGRLGAVGDQRFEQSIVERGIGVTLVDARSAEFVQTLVLGSHYISGPREQFRSPLLLPRLPLGATDETASRSSIRYSASLEASSRVTISVGAEGAVRHVRRSTPRSQTNADLSLLYADNLHSTGGFAQSRLRLGHGLVASMGARAERLSSVGTAQGLVWAETVGAAWSRSFAGITLRLRTAWGNGLRPPEPGMDRAMATATLRQEANPNLAPERQAGVEGGVELFTPGGVQIKATWYHQNATDLIQQVALRNPNGTTRAYQFQNVGAVRNHGIELEAEWQNEQLTANLKAYFPRSAVRQLSKSYTGELEVGDGLVEVPETVGAAFVRYQSARWSLEAGTTWLGPWTGYDWKYLARVEAGTATPRGDPRSYWLRYPTVARPWLSASVLLTRSLTGSIRLDNPGNSAGFVRDNLSPTLGRTLRIGVRKQ